MPIGGSTGPGPAVLRVRLPRPASLLVLHDGTSFAAADTAELDLDVAAPGAYRLEARIDTRLWLLSNPVHLRG